MAAAAESKKVGRGRRRRRQVTVPVVFRCAGIYDVSGCPFKGSDAEELSKHRTVCEYYHWSECKLCSKNVRLRDIPEHEGKCAAEKFECKYCSEELLRSGIKLHLVECMTKTAGQFERLAEPFGNKLTEEYIAMGKKLDQTDEDSPYDPFEAPNSLEEGVVEEANNVFFIRQALLMMAKWMKKEMHGVYSSEENSD
ncbi:MAG: hypothetical protein Hyperionvirus5_118 [Hyperionvirus sp.]|uniref:TRAF-type domain-containing protein n=1 Tax=Hyperionvirus sp. TaxID=2487770 RepID=A0A3G5A8B4_9VIRU|nr:MAG: hypothetical protein Hyperionvirus5_118 [Hyperionvirus sp.]